jgi:hypothetical protein
MDTVVRFRVFRASCGAFIAGLHADLRIEQPTAKFRARTIYLRGPRWHNRVSTRDRDTVAIPNQSWGISTRRRLSKRALPILFGERLSGICEKFVCNGSRSILRVLSRTGYVPRLDYDRHSVWNSNESVTGGYR